MTGTARIAARGSKIFGRFEARALALLDGKHVAVPDSLSFTHASHDAPYCYCEQASGFNEEPDLTILVIINRE